VSTYDAVLNSLTPTEKVRRNVVLLSGLSFLLLNFAINTEGVTFLGARLPREVLYFAIFHALVFYVSALVFHGVFRGLDLAKKISDAAAERAEILSGLEEIDPRVQRRMIDLVEGAKSSLTLLRHERDNAKNDIARLEGVLQRMNPAHPDFDQKERYLREAQRQYASLEARLADQTAVADGTANVTHKARSSLVEEAKRTGKPPSLAVLYVFVGEWLLPIAFGVICASQMEATGIFTPVWLIPS
jgi:hypothetical protein